VADRLLHRHRQARPTNDVARTSLTGPATVVLSGIGVGLESAVYTAVIIGAAVYGAFLLGAGARASLFFIALAGCGLLTTVGVIVAMDTFGPVSDNAQGIAEMSGDVDGEGARILTDLDAVGNTTKAITKGIAIATAVLAATALFGSFTDACHAATGAEGGDGRPRARSPPIPRSPRRLARHPRRRSPRRVGRLPLLRPGHQRRDPRRRRHHLRGAPPVPRDPRDHGGHEKPEYGKVVDICTRDSLRELATPVCSRR
jgi:K(+)-stimulated pyrophosphate-energized sodium pump